MIVVPLGRQLEEAIPTCDSEIALHKLLLEQQAKREQMKALQQPAFMQPEPEKNTPKSTTVWPVAKPQVTPRSGTALEPYPNQKRRCAKKTPTSFKSKINDEDTDGWLVDLDLPSVEEEAFDSLPKGIKFRAEWSDEAKPGYYHNDSGKLVWGFKDMPESTDAEISKAIEESVEAIEVTLDDTNLEDFTAEIQLGDELTDAVEDITTASSLPSIHHVGSMPVVDEEDEAMREIGFAMADLLTPRISDLLTPRLIDILTPRSCRSSAATPSSGNTDYDWDQHISTPRGDWDSLITTPRAVAAC